PREPLADALIRVAELRGLPCVANEVDSTQPWAIIDCADIERLNFADRRTQRQLLVRPGQLLAPLSENDSTRNALRRIARGQEVLAANDRRIAVSFLPDFINAALDLFIDGEAGEWTLVNSGVITEEELLRKLAQILGLEPRLVRGVPAWTLGQSTDESLGHDSPNLLPSLMDALHRYCQDLPPLIEELEPAVGSR
ncbi:MAG TPA: hypothetical protein VGC85_04350, partial [Chthoniobacterales bacterium]